MKTAGILFVLILLAAVRGYALEKEGALNLPAIWRAAEETLPHHLGAAAAKQAMEYSRKSLPVWYRPEVSLEFGYDAAAADGFQRHGYLARSAAVWNIWDGGIGKNSRGIHALGIRSLELEHELEKRRFRIVFADLFFKLAKTAQEITVRHDELASFQRLRPLVTPRLRIGAASASDIQEVDIYLRRIRTGITALSNEQQRLLDTLKTYLGNEFVEKNSRIPDIGALFDGEITMPLPPQADLDQNPFFQHLVMEIQVLEQEQRLRRAELYAPSLQFHIHGGMEPPGDALDPGKPEIAARLAFSVPLFSNRSRLNSLKALRMNTTARQHALEQKRLDIRNYFQQQRNQILLLREEALAARQVIAARRTNLDMAFTEFSRGLKTTSDMVSGIKTLYDDLAESADYQYRLLVLATSYRIETAPADDPGGLR